MAFDQPTRNRLQKLVSDARSLLTVEFTRQLQNDYGLDPESGNISPIEVLTGLDDERLSTAKILRETFNHYQSTSPNDNPKDLLDRIVREQAFTMLNRFAAIRMAEARGILFESISHGYQSKGFQLYSRVAGSGMGSTFEAYRNYLFSVFDELALDLAVLFDRFSPFGRLFPKQPALEELLGLINDPEIERLWAEDETIGWIYQYFNSKEERKKMRDESAAPRNSRELAVRNQFFTPRYVVEFLTDNTLGRTWYEMTRGDTSLVEKCRYMVRRPNEIFLDNGEIAPLETEGSRENLSQEELLKKPVYILHRPLKDPREILMLDPACGSMHFGLYAFDLFLAIYEEAWDLEEAKGPDAFKRSKRLKSLHETYENDRERFLSDVPRLIIGYNIHGVDIDPRAAQIAGLSLWLRAQRAWQKQNVKPAERPQIRRSNIVCAEPMPGEEVLLEEFIGRHFSATPELRLLGEFVRCIFDSMKLAGEAGSLLKIEEEVASLISESREQWLRFHKKAKETPYLFEGARTNVQPGFNFEVGEITDENFWSQAEEKIYKALERYAELTEDGMGYTRQLFIDDAKQGFAFIDICRRKYDAVLMNPPFGDASLPSKPYIDETYGDTKGDVYKAFVECFQDRLMPGGLLGIISSRTGFFLSGSADWRERIVLRLYRPLLLADFGMGVLDAMVETAAYVLRSLTETEDRELTLQLLPELAEIPTDKNDVFSTKKYLEARGLKRFQANAELNRLQTAGFVKYVEGSYPRWSPLRGVIAKAQIPPTSLFPPVVCFRLLGENDKRAAIDEIFRNEDDSRRFVAKPDDFRLVPNSPFCYWVSNDFKLLYSTLEKFNNNRRDVRVGLQTNDDFQWLRLMWEVSNKTINRTWFYFAKGGAYSKYYSNPDLVVEWQDNGLKIKEWKLAQLSAGKITANNSKCWNESWYFREGLTFPRRTSRLGFRILPKGCVFADKGPAIILERGNQDEVLGLCGILNSSAYYELLSLQLGRTAIAQSTAQSFESGLIRQTPIPNYDNNSSLSKLVTKSYETKRSLDTANEISHVFRLPALLQVGQAPDLGKSVESWKRRVDQSEEKLREYQREIDNIAFRLYGISDEDRRQIENNSQQASAGENGDEDAGAEEGESLTVEQKLLTADLLAYALGAAFGRWDVRFATGKRHAPEFPGPFAPLPVSPPGMLQNAEGLPAAPEDISADYPLEIVWNGILVDDAGSANDVENRLREVLRVIWKDGAEAIELEVCEILGVPTLREYFLRPSGFFADHLKRYSKSRRQAPIYLPLSTRSGSYTLWLYYHRLSDQTLYTAVNDFIDPKLRQVKDEAASLGSKQGRSRDDEKRLEQLTELASELEEFRDEILRLAPIWKPNLNDGVQITVSPLWKLFRLPKWRKTLEDTWKKIEKGDYDWAHLAYSFFPERVREKCRHDKSLAIAHDLENLYVEPPAKARKARTKHAQTASLPLADG